MKIDNPRDRNAPEKMRVAIAAKFQNVLQLIAQASLTASLECGPGVDAKRESQDFPESFSKDTNE